MSDAIKFEPMEGVIVPESPEERCEMLTAMAFESFSAAVDDGVATDEEIESVSRQVAEACDAFHALKGCLEALRIRKERRQ